MQLVTLHPQPRPRNIPGPGPHWVLVPLPPSHFDEMVWMLVVFIETFLYLSNSHQDCSVCLDILVVITCQGDIWEQGLYG